MPRRHRTTRRRILHRRPASVGRKGHPQADRWPTGSCRRIWRTQSGNIHMHPARFRLALAGMVLIAMVACEPIYVFPGGALSGPEHPAPADWGVRRRRGDRATRGPSVEPVLRQPLGRPSRAALLRLVVLRRRLGNNGGRRTERAPCASPDRSIRSPLLPSRTRRNSTRCWRPTWPSTTWIRTRTLRRVSPCSDSQHAERRCSPCPAP